MPFFNQSREPQYFIDNNKLKPIAVIVNFAPNGKILPIYIKYIHPDETEETVKIDSVKYTKDILGGYQYCCYVTISNRRHEIFLNYYVKIHSWYINK